MFRASVITTLFAQHRQLILYGLIGLTGATLDLVVYIALYKGLGIAPFIASFLSVSVGIMNNFGLNARYNFGKTNHLGLRFVSFYATGLAGALLSTGLILALHDGLGLGAMVAKLLTIAPVVLLQFVINKHVSFTDSPRDTLRQLARLAWGSYRPVWLIMLAAGFFFSAIYFQAGHDEMDNLLGGKLLWSGQLPYLDYFSHHAPGMYYVAGLLYPLIFNDIFAYRLAHNVLVFGLLLVTYWQVRQRVGRAPADTYLVLTGLSNVIGLGYMALAESLISHLFILSLVLVYFRNDDRLSLKMVCLLSLLLFLIPFMSLGYIFLCLVLYTAIAWLLIKEWWPDRSKGTALFKLAGGGLVLALPCIIYGWYAWWSGSWSDIAYNLFVYNATIYPAFAQETGGGVIQTLAHGLLNSWQQIVTVLAAPGIHAVQTLLLLGFGLFGYYLWQRDRRLEAVLLGPLLLLLNTRINTWNPPAITSDLAKIAQHGDMYISVALLALAIGATYVLQHKPRLWQWQTTLSVVAIAGLTVVPVAIYAVWQSQVHRYLYQPVAANYWQVAQEVKTFNAATPINAIAQPGDRAWIGVADFRSQLYLEPRRATYFTFFQKHIAASALFTERFTQELEKERPVAVRLEWDQVPLAVQAILERDYIQLTDARLKDYYFLASQETRITERLQAHGYQTQPR